MIKYWEENWLENVGALHPKIATVCKTMPIWEQRSVKHSVFAHGSLISLQVTHWPSLTITQCSEGLV